MFSNYLVTSFRNLLRYRSYTVINIVGLTVGLAASLFIFMWVIDEVTFDRFHAKKDSIYRVLSNHIYPDGKVETYGATSMLLGPAMKAELPEIDQMVQLSWNTEMLMKAGDKSFNESGFYGDPALFSVFSFPVVAGDQTNPLPDIKSIVISKKLANKLFGTADPLGKHLEVNHSYDLTVTGVFADVPRNSTLQFDFVISFALFEKDNPWAKHWRAGGMQTLVTLKEGANVEAANAKTKDLVKRNCNECTIHPSLFRYADLHLYGTFENGQSVGGRIQQVWLFVGVAAIILIMACINFMNLATARAATRGREVGVRKSIGASRTGLVMQFLSESALLSCVAMTVALAAVQFLLPVFNEITGKAVQIDFGNAFFVSGLVLITLVCGLLAGSYPALILSAFKPAAVLKGNVQSSLSGGGIRKALVVVQFMSSTILIVGSIVVQHQIDFISTKNLGFDKEHVIVIKQQECVRKNHEAFKNDLLQYPFIKGVGFGGSAISTIPITTHDPVWPGKQDASLSFKVFRCDDRFIPTMNIQMMAGRNFSNLGRGDSANYIINLKAMEAMGLSLQNVIGTELEMWNGKGKIIGVTHDFNNGSLREGIEPLIFMYSESNGMYYYVKTTAQGDLRQMLSALETTVRRYDPDYPFQYWFLDDMLNQEYQNEAVIGQLSKSFTVVAVLISCLGLFGLASFTAERRRKELGVRKTMGATTFNLVTLLCADFARLVLIALLIAGPAAWYVAQNFLSKYAFHAELSAYDFVVPGIGLLLLTILTVGQRSISAASDNPVNALRSE